MKCFRRWRRRWRRWGLRKPMEIYRKMTCWTYCGPDDRQEPPRDWNHSKKPEPILMHPGEPQIKTGGPFEKNQRRFWCPGPPILVFFVTPYCICHGEECVCSQAVRLEERAVPRLPHGDPAGTITLPMDSEGSPITVRFLPQAEGWQANHCVRKRGDAGNHCVYNSFDDTWCDYIACRPRPWPCFFFDKR